MIDFSVPLSGMSAAASTLDRTAARIAQSGFPGGDAVDLSSEVVALIEARNSFAANAKVARTEDQVSQSLLNLLG